MTIASEITRIQNNIAGAYTALSAKGATLPANQNSANLATTVASVPAGSGETVTATNSSSYDRVSGEKVWLNKSGNNYSIINYASADINSLIGVCKQNIAIGASGSVETLDDGTLVPHLARDFVLGSGITESNIDDASTLLTVPLCDSNGVNTKKGFVVSNVIDMPSTAETNFKFKIKFKITDSGGATPDLTTLSLNLGYMSYDNSTDYPTTGIAPKFSLDNHGSIIGYYPGYSGGVQTSLSVYYASSGILNVDSWLTLSIETNTSSPNAKLTITDANGQTYTNTNANNCWFNSHAVKRVFVGFFTGVDNSTLSAVFDLSECGLFSRDESTTYWTPYKEVEG